ncbi:hypothetical protein ACXYTJ_16030 [Gilvimarinus sp. F26214L]|uniref:hypothetical protein n=1 Tax=Gilvimarinus sp. DZF01 TaxID=3461371 RepID=UPI004046640F
MRLTRETNAMDDATRRAQQQIQAVRHRAQKELERAAARADRALGKSNRTTQQYPVVLAAIAGTAVVGGVAAWLLSRKRPS